MAKLVAHQILAIGLSLYMLRPSSIGETFTIAFLALTASTIPDLDSKLDHRKLLHNLFAVLLTSLTIYIVLSAFSSPIAMNPIYHITSYIIGYLSHIAVDMFTCNGVALLYPVSKKRYRVFGTSYDNPIYNGAIITLGSILLYFYLTS